MARVRTLAFVERMALVYTPKVSSSSRMPTTVRAHTGVANSAGIDQQARGCARVTGIQGAQVVRPAVVPHGA